VALGVALLATTVPTWAGQVITGGEVSIYIGSDHSSAGGTMVGASYSADNQQYIECETNLSTIISIYLTLCYAQDKAGQSILCVSRDPKFQETLQAMTDSSYISFQADPRAICTSIVISDGSNLLK
jgi:hypothetical protein